MSFLGSCRGAADRHRGAAREGVHVAPRRPVQLRPDLVAGERLERARVEADRGRPSPRLRRLARGAPRRRRAYARGTFPCAGARHNRGRGRGAHRGDEIRPRPHLLGGHLQAVRDRRERIASTDEAERLLTALTEPDRPIWATTLAGLRRGERMALRWEDVDLANGVTPRHCGRTTRRPVSRSAEDPRRPPDDPDRRLASRHPRRAQGEPDSSRRLVFRGDGRCQPSKLWRRARSSWKRGGVEPIGLHEARDTFASILIAAGVNARRSRRTWVTRRSRRRTTSTASSCLATRPRRQRSSTRISPARTALRASLRCSRRQVDLFDFRSVLMGRIQPRW